MNRHIDAVTPVAAHQHRRVPAGIQAFHHSHGNFLSVGRNDRPKRRLQLVLPRDAHRQRTMAHEFCDICANVVKIGVAAQGRRAKCEGDGGTAGVLGGMAGKKSTGFVPISKSPRWGMGRDCSEMLR